MIVRNKKVFYQGLILAMAFVAVLYYMFTPSFNGVNAFHASDDLFNSISKGSTYYIPQVKEGIKKYDGKLFELTIFSDNEKIAPYASTLLSANGIMVSDAAKGIKISGDLGVLMTKVTDDSDAMFKNNGQVLVQKYGMDEKQAMYVWWLTMKEVKSALDQQKVYAPATFIDKNVVKRAIEVGYNYYGIEGQAAADRWGTIAFSLVFYVVYTMWWGYAIFFMFEGVGLEMTSSRKKEM
jgi:cbb3-type cytochrome oxidase subunit 3